MNPHTAPRGEWKPYGDSGGASRFFYVAKTAKRERNLYCEHLPERSGGEATDREDGSAGVDNPRAGAGRGGGARNFHPTVKPVSLLRYLCRLITPPGGVVLDPFTGSASTAIASLMDGYRFIGCEQSAEYLPIATARVTGAHDRPELARALLGAGSAPVVDVCHTCGLVAPAAGTECPDHLPLGAGSALADSD